MATATHYFQEAFAREHPELEPVSAPPAAAAVEADAEPGAAMGVGGDAAGDGAVPGTTQTDQLNAQLLKAHKGALDAGAGARPD